MMMLDDNARRILHYLRARCDDLPNCVGSTAYALSVLIAFEASGHSESASILEEQPNVLVSPPGTLTFM